MPVYSYITVSLKLYDIVSSANLERAIQAIRTSSSESASPPPQYNEVQLTAGPGANFPRLERHGDGVKVFERTSILGGWWFGVV